MAYLDLGFTIDGKLKRFQEMAREFGRDVVRPAGIELDKLKDPADVIKKESILWDVFRGYRELGLHKLMIPKAFGGTMGTMGPLAPVLLNEEMGYADGGLAVSLMVASMPFAFAMASPTAEVRNWAREFVEDKSATMVGCWAITEPDHGTDWVMGTCKEGCDPATAPDLTAVKKGDEYILNGWKSAWVSNGTIATHAVVHVGLDASLGVHGSGIALCPLDLPGISRGNPLDKVGQRPLNQGEIIFDEVKLHKKYMLIPIPGIFGSNPFGLTFVGMANGSMGMTFCGLARAVLEETVKFTKENTREGRPLDEHKDVQLALFRMFIKVEAARNLARQMGHHFFSSTSSPMASLLTSSKTFYWGLSKSLDTYFKLYQKYPSVRERAKGFTHPEESSDLMEWSKYGVASKLLSTETAFEVAGEAMQILGEKAMDPAYPIEKMWRDARASLIEDGANDSLAIAAYEGL